MLGRSFKERVYIWASEDPDAEAFVAHCGPQRRLTLSREDFLHAISNAAAALHERNLRAGGRIAICAPNSIHWEILDKAALSCGIGVLGIDARSPVSHVLSVLEDLQPDGLFSDRPELLYAVGRELPDIARYTFGSSGDAGTHVSSLDWPAILAPAPPHAELKSLPDIGADAKVLIAQTSGTTGRPKLLAYTHEQLLLALDAIQQRLPLTADDISLCWLPLANLFQRIANLHALLRGARIHILDDPRHIQEVLPTVAPTFLIGVPRFYEKIVDVVSERERTLVADHEQSPDAPSATPTGSLRLRRRILSAFLGNRIRFLLTGSAKCPEKTLAWFRRLEIPLLEAYGLSESIVPVAMSTPTDARLGSVGRPLSPSEVRIGPGDRLHIRGPGIFSAYLSHYPSTYQFTDDGFLVTEDLGFLDSDGYLYISGRANDVVKLSTGRAVNLVELESSLESCPAVEQAIVVADARTVAVAICTVSSAAEYPTAGEDADDESATAAETTIAGHVEAINASLREHERVAGLILSDILFSATREELTPTEKKRRKSIEQHYRSSLTTLDRSLRSRQPSTEPLILWHQP